MSVIPFLLSIRFIRIHVHPSFTLLAVFISNSLEYGVRNMILLIAIAVSQAASIPR
jgi:hypothetical protein